MLNFRSIITGILAGILICSTGAQARADEELVLSALRTTVNCGPNAVLMFLVLCGVNPSDDAIDSIDCSLKGASLLDLSRFAEDHGVRTEVRMFQPSQFSRIPLPAICQTRGTNSRNVRHFIVAYDVDSTGIHALDATTGKYARVRPERFESYLSGYALVRQQTLIQRFFAYQHWVCFGLLAAIILVIWGKSSETITVKPNSGSVGVAVEKTQ